MPSPQTDILAFLSDPATHDGVRPRRIDTHISSVFLAGERVLKLKKAVCLPFLDFTTPESRRAACEAELAINRRAAPNLYLGVAAVTREAHGGFALDGRGEAVEWLVVMRRFDQRTLFSRLVAANKLTRPLMHALTEAVWEFHRAAPVRRDRGGVAGLTWTIDTNAKSMAAHADMLPTAQVALLAEQSRAWLARLAPIIEERRNKGLVRQCHGDLHCGNICLFENKPTLFDAIEFSEDIACIDVFYDLAFLLMDLDHRGARHLASLVLNHYLDLSGDYQGVMLLPLLLSLRAAIRAHVTAAMAAGSRGAKRIRLAGEAGSYLDAALAYLAPPPARLVAVGGLSGSGKSRMGRELAPLLAVPGAAVVRTDALRKQLMGCSLLDSLGPEGYSPEVTARTYEMFFETCGDLLRAGHAVVADGVFAKPEQRAAIEDVAAQAGVRFDGLWLSTPPELAAERIEGRKDNASDATVAVLRQQLDYDLGAIGWAHIDTSGTKNQALAHGRAALGL